MRKPIEIIGFLLLISFSACDYWKWELDAVRPPHPQVTEIEPAIARFDSIITLKGMFFCPGDPGFHQVRFPNGKYGEIQGAPTNTTIVVKVPMGAGCGPIIVEYNGFSSDDYEPGSFSVSGQTFIYQRTPVRSELFAGVFEVDDCGESCLSSPTGVDVDRQGNVAVADKKNHVVRLYDKSGTLIASIGRIGTSGYKDDPFTGGEQHALFTWPNDVAFDSNGNIYVADGGNEAIRKIDDSSLTVSSVAGHNTMSGFVDNVCGDKAQFNSPKGISANDRNHLFIADDLNDRIRLIEVDNGACSSDAEYVSTFIGSVHLTSVGLDTMNKPFGVHFTKDLAGTDVVLIADRDEHRILSVSVSTKEIEIIAQKNLNRPTDITTDDKGFIYIADKFNDQIKVVTPHGELQALTGKLAGHLLSPKLVTNLQRPEGIAYYIEDTDHHYLYIADTGRHIVRKVLLK